MAGSWGPAKDFILATGKPAVGRSVGRIIEALSETIIPAGGELPIAVNETGSHLFLAKYLRDLEPGARFGIKALLIAFDLLPAIFIFRFSRFVNLSAADKERYLRNWQDSRIYYRRMAVVLFKTIIGMGFYNDPKVLAAIGFKLNCEQPKPPTAVSAPRSNEERDDSRV